MWLEVLYLLCEFEIHLNFFRDIYLIQCCVQPRWEGPVDIRSWQDSGRVKLSAVNLNCDVIFIMFKASTQGEGEWEWGWLAESLWKVSPFPQQSKISFTGNAVKDCEYNVSN